MLEGLAGFVDFLEIVVTVFVKFFENLFFLITSVSNAIASIVTVLGFFPAFLTVPIMAIISLSLLITLLNHWG